LDDAHNPERRAEKEEGLDQGILALLTMALGKIDGGIVRIDMIAMLGVDVTAVIVVTEKEAAMAVVIGKEVLGETVMIEVIMTIIPIGDGIIPDQSLRERNSSVYILYSNGAKQTHKQKKNSTRSNANHPML